MEFRWSKRKYDLKTFVKGYSNQLPIIVNVIEGFYGIDEEDAYTFSKDDVYRLTDLNKQSRVIVKDVIGRHISLPLHHPMQFHLINETYQEPHRLEAEPLSGLVPRLQPGDKIIAEDDGMVDFWLGVDNKKGEKLGVLTFKAEYHEHYLVGNTVNEGDLEEEPLVIPVYASVIIAVAEGLEKQSSEEFDRICQQFAKRSSGFRNHVANGNLEIMLFDGKVSDFKDYDYVKPSCFLRTNFQVTKDGYAIPCTSGDGTDPRHQGAFKTKESHYQRLIPVAPMPKESKSSGSDNEILSLHNVKAKWNISAKNDQLTSSIQTKVKDHGMYSTPVHKGTPSNRVLPDTVPKGRMRSPNYEFVPAPPRTTPVETQWQKSSAPKLKPSKCTTEAIKQSGVLTETGFKELQAVLKRRSTAPESDGNQTRDHRNPAFDEASMRHATDFKATNSFSRSQSEPSESSQTTKIHWV